MASTHDAAASGMLEVVGAIDSPFPHAARVLGPGCASTYFNPALLTRSAPEFGVSFAVVHQAMNLSYAVRPAGTDISPQIYRARLPNPDGTTSRLTYYPLPTQNLRQHRGSHDPDQTDFNLVLGSVTQVIPDRLAFGIYASLPLRHLSQQGSFFSDEREQYFSNSLHYELLEDRLAGHSISFAVAYQPWDWLSAGMGASLVNVSQAQTFVFIPDASDQEVVDATSQISVDYKLTPHFGLAIQPFPGLRITGSAHLPLKSTTHGVGDIQFWDYEYPSEQSSLIQNFVMNQGVNPLRLSLGTSWQAQSGDTSWQVGASLLWAQWSAYQNRQQRTPQEAWSDTLTLVVAVGWWMWNQHWAVELFHVPTPVPTQTGRTNYVDNDRTGLGVSWRWPFSLWKKEFFLSVQIQAQHLWYQRVTKSDQAQHPVFDEFPDSVDIQTGQPIPDASGFQTNNPGWPGYAFDGWLLVSGISIKSQF